MEQASAVEELQATITEAAEQSSKSAVDIRSLIEGTMLEVENDNKVAEEGISPISDVIQTNAAVAQESSATSQELSALAASLDALIAKFETPAVKRS